MRRRNGEGPLCIMYVEMLSVLCLFVECLFVVLIPWDSYSPVPFSHSTDLSDYEMSWKG